MTVQETREGNGFEYLGRCIACLYCDSLTASPVGVWANFNAGDGLISAHAHVNVVFECERGHQFAVRGYVDVRNMYYGDLRPDGGVCDMSLATQDMLQVAAQDPDEGEIRMPNILERWKEVTGEDLRTDATK